MGLKITYVPGQTPLDEDETQGLLLQSISTQAELNEHEQMNIESAVQWTLHQKIEAEQVLSEKFVKGLHKRMFAEVWDWAGKFRLTEKNIGVQAYRIGVELKQLNDDCLFWIKTSAFSSDEIALRYKHRLVSIHCFSNGNGRHARLMADVLISKVLGNEIFSWGQKIKERKDPQEQRVLYLKALKLADNGLYDALLKFARK